MRRARPERREGAIAIRITKLCNDINDEGQLDLEQRIVVVIQALEFCKSDGIEVSKLERGFIFTLAEGLNISKEEYDILEKFVLNPFTDIPSSQNLLVISGRKDSWKQLYQICFKGSAERTDMDTLCTIGKFVLHEIHPFG